MKTNLIPVAFSLFALWSVSCSTSGDRTTPGADGECTEGESRACDCAGGGRGRQVCVFDGVKAYWEQCGECKRDGTDAGWDSGNLDAGGHDAGVVDAGQDTGLPDTGHDVGPFDAGVDSGTPDTGSADTGADAGSPDTGIVITCGPSPTGMGGDMCDVAAGAFQMGCNSAVDTECFGGESPYHSVTVPAFKVDKYEVTAAEYKACVDASGCTAANTTGGCNYNVGGKESHPIDCVDWNQAKAYCEWAGKRLPTEAEWEKAARGTDGRKYPWGNDALDCNRAVHSVSPCNNSGTVPVGSKPAGVSPYGAEDMEGNVWEWVEDWYHDSYTGAPSDGSAWVNPAGSYRVWRGGSWGHVEPGYLRASYRGRNYPTSRSDYGGFRCAGSPQ